MTTTAPPAPASTEVPLPARRPRLLSRRTLTGHPLGTICAVYLVLLVIAVAAAPLLAPHDPATQDLARTLSGPSGRHWLGTDQLGRDVTSRLLYGGRAALADVAVAVATVLLVGVPAGLLAGYTGGWVDRVIMRLADLVFAVPGIIVLLLVVAIFPGNDVIAMITLGIIHSAGFARVIRGQTLAYRNDLFVKAAVLSGLRTPAILRRHILPSLSGPVIVQASLFAASALVIESGLSFLGLLRPDVDGPTWGNMVTQAANVSNQDPWLLVPAGGTVAVTVVAFSLLGDAIRDATVGRSVPAVSLRRTTRGHIDAPPDSPPADSGALLSVAGLSVTLQREGTTTAILSDVSFTVAPGECVGIVGESGCGKSTTAKAILGLLPANGRITAGSVRFDGVELGGLPDKELARIRGAGIALVSQDPLNSLDPAYTIGSQLREVVRRHSTMDRKGAEQRTLELLRMVRFPDPTAIVSRRAHELSGGMAQRVGIALALAAGPRLLIADEPTSALDVTVQAEILALLRDLRRQLDMAVILVTHDWGVLADICDRTLVMYAGQIVESGPLEQVYAHPGHPYSGALLASNPQLVAVGEPLPTIDGKVPAPGQWPTGCRFAPRCRFASDDCSLAAIPLTALPGGRTSRCIHTDELLESR
jgi:peptide/nickel transport system permease protein